MSGPSCFTAVGGLLPSDLLDRVSLRDRSLPGTDPTSYDLVPGERLNDAITRSWNRLVGIWGSFRTAEESLPQSDQTAATVTRERWLLPLLQELGFVGGLERMRDTQIGEKRYPISDEWHGQVPVHLLGARAALDRTSTGTEGGPRFSPHGLVQEFLNRSESHLWAILSNGLLFRLLRDNASLTRQAYVEFDLESMFDGNAYAEFSLLWLTCHRSRFDGPVAEQCLLEQWTNEAAAAGTRALDKLRQGVESAIETLGKGFLAHPANKGLRDALRSGEVSTTEYQHQLLRTVYRLLFLLVAESRDLLLDPDAGEVERARYKAFYSLERIRKLSVERRGSTHDDLWLAIGIVFAALGHDGQQALALKPLGSFLWSADATGALAGARLDNLHVLDALRHLGQVDDGESRVVRRVDYRNLGAEELGSVYEALLELHASVDVANRTFSLTSAQGNERKTTGSYYTPASLINELLDSALEPVLSRAADDPNPEQAILDLSVIDPACGSGHFLIAAANRIAHRLALVRAEGAEPSPLEVRGALRDVVGRCLHGIDVNPMAVELCKVSLWLEAMEPGKPLSFLEHRIVCGNALLGTTPKLLAEGVPDGAFKPLTGDDPEVVSERRKRNKSERAGGQGTQGMLDLGGVTVADHASGVAKAIAQIDALPADTVEQIEEKQRLLDELERTGATRRARLGADAWCAAFVAPKGVGETPITTATVRQIMDDPDRAPADVLELVDELTREYAFVHLHLAFPDVITAAADHDRASNPDAGWDGGFAVVLGNPPWERVKLQEKEWFAARDPEIATAPNAAARKRLIEKLQEDAPDLFAEFLRDLRHSEGESRILRDSGKYPLCGRGDVNTYTVFTEAMRMAVSPHGRVGVIIPSGIATDDTTKYFFQSVVEDGSLVSLFDFENRKQIFSGIDSRIKFCLLTLTGPQEPVSEAEFVFFATDTADLADPDRRFTLSTDDFELLNPNTRTCPIFRTLRDAEITKAIYERVPVLIREGPPRENPWGVEFSRMFDMSNDSKRFRTREQLEDDDWDLQGNLFVRGHERYLPLYEAKMVGLFDHRAADVVLSETATIRQGQPSAISDQDHRDGCRTPQPRAWVAASAVQDELEGKAQRQLLALRSVTSPTNERTTMPVLIGFVAVGNSLPVLLLEQPQDAAVLGTILSAFVSDFVARLKVGGINLNFFFVQQFPAISPEDLAEVARWQTDISIREWIELRASELYETSWDVSDRPYRWDPERRALLRAELDAAFFHLYGIERHDVDYIMDTFPIVRRKDEAQYGEYRTKRLILEVYDRMQAAIESSVRFDSTLEPPPGDPSMRHLASTRPAWADLYQELVEAAQAAAQQPEATDAERT